MNSGEVGLLCADGEFALVFVPAEFTLDGHMRAFGEGGGEISQFPEGHASMPIGARFPGSGIVLPGRLGGEREDRDVGCVGDLSFSVAADETDEGDSVEVHTFLLFCPFVSGTRGRVGAAPQARSCFSGGTGTGEPEPVRCESKAEASQTPGAAKAPKQCRVIGQDRKRDRTDHHSVDRSRRRDALIQTIADSQSLVLEVNAEVPRAVAANG